MALPLVLRRLILQLGVATAFVACLTSTGRAALPSGNVVQQWNTIAENIVVGSGAFQNEGLIYMAYVSAAVYDAVAAIEDGYGTMLHRSKPLPVRPSRPLWSKRLTGRSGIASGTSRRARRTVRRGAGSNTR